jgi:dipeptidyl aminopeptidase/acylaminoacyl peptidase
MPSVHVARLRQISAAILMAFFATPGFIILLGVWISTAVIYVRVDRFIGISNGDIYIIASNGNEITNITQSGSYERLAALSPDGSRIIFTSDRTGVEEIYLMNSDGTGITQLTEGVLGVFALSWSPDSTRIAFSARGNDSPDIFVLNVTNGAIQNITNSVFDESHPTWSPNSERLAFTSDRDGSSELYTIDSDGSNYTRITSLNLEDEIAQTHSPVWSPDGTMIAFGARGRIFRIHPDGTGLFQVGEDGDTVTIWFGNDTLVYWLRGGPQWVAISTDGTDRRLINLPWPEDFQRFAFPNDWQPPTLLPAHPPVAVAGPDQTLTADRSGNALVTLDATGSIVGDGELRNMRWQWDGNDYFASLSSPQLEVTLGVGVHEITLFIQNSRLMTATDTVTITVLAQDSATPIPTDTAVNTSEPTSSLLPAAR